MLLSELLVALEAIQMVGGLEPQEAGSLKIDIGETVITTFGLGKPY